MGKGKTILIVDDEVFLIKILRERLETEGFLVIGAEDGADGLKKALEGHPDMILLDMAMPVMDGMTMLKKLRQDKWGKNALVIALSNINNSELKEELFANGVCDFLVKVNNTLDGLAGVIRKNLKE